MFFTSGMIALVKQDEFVLDILMFATLFDFSIDFMRVKCNTLIRYFQHHCNLRIKMDSELIHHWVFWFKIFLLCKRSLNLCHFLFPPFFSSSITTETLSFCLSNNSVLPYSALCCLSGGHCIVLNSTILLYNIVYFIYIIYIYFYIYYII